MLPVWQTRILALRFAPKIKQPQTVQEFLKSGRSITKCPPQTKLPYSFARMSSTTRGKERIGFRMKKVVRPSTISSSTITVLDRAQRSYHSKMRMGATI